MRRVEKRKRKKRAAAAAANIAMAEQIQSQRPHITDKQRRDQLPPTSRTAGA